MLRRGHSGTTRLSTKGQVILPKELREKRGWKPGAEFVLEERPDGVFLKVHSEAGRTKIEDVFGCLGPAKRVASVEEMDQAVLDEAKRRWGREYDDRD